MATVADRAGLPPGGTALPPTAVAEIIPAFPADAVAGVTRHPDSNSSHVALVGLMADLTGKGRPSCCPSSAAAGGASPLAGLTRAPI